MIQKVYLFFLIINTKQCKWKIGQKCLALYTEDEMYYEAVILDLTPSSHPNNAFVRFDYYGNEQETPFSDLLPEECKHELKQDVGSIATEATPVVDSSIYCNSISDVKENNEKRTTTSDTDEENDEQNLNNKFASSVSLSYLFILIFFTMINI